MPMPFETRSLDRYYPSAAPEKPQVGALPKTAPSGSFRDSRQRSNTGREREGSHGIGGTPNTPELLCISAYMAKTKKEPGSTEVTITPGHGTFPGIHNSALGPHPLPNCALGSSG